MIDTGLYVSFLLVSSAIIVIPGPNVSVIVATSLTQGRIRGLQTVSGTLAAMTVQLLIAAKGTAILAETLAQAFTVLKWLGAAYLVYLGLCRFRAALASDEAGVLEVGSAALEGEIAETLIHYATKNSVDLFGLTEPVGCRVDESATAATLSVRSDRSRRRSTPRSPGRVSTG